MKKQESAVPIGAEGEKFIKRAYFLKIFNEILLLCQFQWIVDAWPLGHLPPSMVGPYSP